jgi:hypothetical protein
MSRKKDAARLGFCNRMYAKEMKMSEENSHTVIDLRNRMDRVEDDIKTIKELLEAVVRDDDTEMNTQEEALKYEVVGQVVEKI